MPGRPPLRLGAHGKITRVQVADGVWIARCRYRDRDGVTRRVERRTPDGVRDEYGAQAEEELRAALDARRPPGAGTITGATLIVDLLDRYLDRAEGDGELAAKTVDTYRATLAAVRPRMAGIKVGEADPATMDDILRGIRRDHGATRERHTKVALNSVLTAAVMAKAIPANPIRELAPRRKRKGQKVKGAPAVPMALGAVIAAVRTSEACQAKDLADPITVLAGTGLRRSELLGLRWQDIDLEARTATIAGSVVRVKGKGLIRQDHTKTGEDRTIPLPRFVCEALSHRRDSWSGPNSAGVIFPSTTGTLRDPDNLGRQWREVRDDLGLPEVSSHSFRRTVATLLDGAGLSARVGADQLGHSRPSMTQDVYMARGQIHPEVADALDAAITTNKRQIGEGNGGD